MIKPALLLPIFLCLFSMDCFGQKVVKKVYPSRIKGAGKDASQFHFYIYYPKSHEKMKAAKKWRPTILLNPNQPLSKLRRGIKELNEPGAYYSYYFRLSEKHGIPLIAFTNPRHKDGHYTTEGNDWELTESDRALYQKRFELLMTPWKRSLEDFCKKQGIYCGEFLGLGLSKGAQSIARIAMTWPEMFHSVESLLPGSNPTPSPEGKHIYWLQLSGGRDGGYPKCHRFYHKAVEMGYTRMFYQAPHFVGHMDKDFQNRYTRSFRDAFYDYVLSGKEKPENAKAFVGDYMNHIATPTERAGWIPEAQRVYFPDGKMAEAWGPVEE